MVKVSEEVVEGGKAYHIELTIDLSKELFVLSQLNVKELYAEIDYSNPTITLTADTVVSDEDEEE